MSSSFVIEPQESGSKKDDTLIIVVNDDGTISVDQATLENLIMNQSDANVSVVRVGQTDGDAANGDLTLTVDPPAPFISSEAAIGAASTATTDNAGLVDPFMEMDPEQLEKLETALQSEQAKQILGENVTAMLDMLTVEEQQKSIKYCIELDHCYTSRTSPSDPEPTDPLPIANSPDIEEAEFKHTATTQPAVPPPLVPFGFAEAADAATPPARPKVISNVPLLRPVITRGRKIAAPVVQQVSAGVPKAVSNTLQRGPNVSQQAPTKGTASVRPENEVENEEATTSSESSESEPPSDDDSDFGPRGPRRGGVRARGGRKGLTTRGGSMAATRRRGPNKQMDMEQVRRLDMEMAAAVDAMKSPEKPDKSTERFTPAKTKKQLKTSFSGGKKKEDPSPSRGTSGPSLASAASPAVNENPPPAYEKPLQTTNQVKANLINANMIKGDMILTKPGQARNNQKVLLVQKKVMVKANELRNHAAKKQSIILAKGGKTMPMQVQTKLGTSEDGKLISLGGKTIGANVLDAQQPVASPTPAQSPCPPADNLLQQETPPTHSPPASHLYQHQQQPQQTQLQEPAVQQPQQQHAQQQLQQTQQQHQKHQKPAASALPVKPKTPEIKKERKKSEPETTPKVEEAAKPVETKVPDVSKKALKKDHRKPPAIIADAMGPALFSTPDIIRRVSCGPDAKTPEVAPATPTTPLASPAPSSASGSLTTPNSSSTQDPDLPPSADSTKTHEEVADAKRSQNEQTTAETEPQIKSTLREEPSAPSPRTSQLNSGEPKEELRVPTAEELQSSLDPATNSALAGSAPEHARAREEPVVANDIVAEPSGIEGEEHLLATLAMEASKHEEELLAEAFLLQEELGVDLADHGGLVEPTASLPENLLSTTAFDTSMENTQSQVSSAMGVESTKAEESAVHPLPRDTAASASPVVHAPPMMIAVAHPPETARKRDEKEPIQIVRGGRVITLPPIEAPATRSKRLQVKAETPQKTLEALRKEEKTTKQTVQQQQHLMMAQQQMKEIEEMESEMDDDEDDDEDDNSDSEDDPDRLWCICKRPHNNRFMICCDVCEDWFHGKCVHVSKAMGQQMEEKGIEWVCPNCTKKKEQDSGAKHAKLESAPVKAPKFELVARVAASQPVPIPPQRTIPTPSEKLPSKISSSADHGMAPVSGVTQCVVCKKEARNSSIYCSDACILMHAQETLTKESKPPAVTQPKTAQPGESPKASPDARVIVFERRTGKVLTGSDAPTTSNFKTWLKENPTFEVVRPNNLNTLQIGGKTVTAIQTQGVGKLANKPAQMTPGVQAKMVYTKVVGSKQTVLAPSNKKLVFLSGGQQRASVSPKTVQQQQQPQQQQQQQQRLTSANKNLVMRQTTIKILPQQVKLPAPTTPKPAIVKKQEAKSSTPQPQQKAAQKTPPAKKTEPEPIRLNVRKTLTELLTSRIKETQDLKLTEEEVNELALNIELELYKHFRDTGAKYKAKYRSLVFNIKDTKNLTLFRKIADRSLTPDAVVRLSPDEMASQELAEWREKETKHQLEMIKKNELDLMSQAKSIVVKTHKGEQIIENEGGMDHVDPKTPVQDIVTALNSHEPSLELTDDKDDRASASLPSSSSQLPAPSIDDSKRSRPSEDRRSKDKDRDKDRANKSKDKDRVKEKKDERSHRSGSHRSKDRERSREKSRDERRSTRSKDAKRDGKSGRERDRDKERDRDRDKPRDKPKDKDRQRKSRSSRAGHKDYNGRDKDKKEEERKRESAKKSADPGNTQSEPEKPIEDRLWRHVEEETTTNTLDGNDSDVSDREPSSTVNIKTPDINEESERTEREAEPQPPSSTKLTAKGHWQTVWRGFVNMVDVAKFFITAQEVSGHAKDLMDDLPDTVDVVGRISHETVWDYISKMKKTGSKEILVIRLTAANDEEKIPYITLYSYLNSRSRLGVVGNVSKNIKDFYIMPFSRQSQIPPVLLPLIGPGFEDQRPHLLLGIIVRNKRKRFSTTQNPALLPPKVAKKDNDASFAAQATGGAAKEKANAASAESPPRSPSESQPSISLPPLSPRAIHKELLLESFKEKQKVTQMTLESLNKAHVGMSRTVIDNATISKIVPELSSKIDILASSPKGPVLDDPLEPEEQDEQATKETEKRENETDDGDEPYSPGEIDEDRDDTPAVVKPSVADALAAGSILSPMKNSTELQRKMDELNRQIEEQKQQIQSISSSFLGDATPTLPGLGLDPPDVDMDEAYSPTDARSFTPPPPGIAKFAQPILDKVSDITIPPNLQEILANVKRQESSKVDPYLPSKPSATFLTSANTPAYPKLDSKYTPSFIKNTGSSSERQPPPPLEKPMFESPPPSSKGTKGTLSSLSELDLIKKAEEELAAVAAATAAAEVRTLSTIMSSTTVPPTLPPPSSAQSHKMLVPPPFSSPPPSTPSGNVQPHKILVPPPFSTPPPPLAPTGGVQTHKILVPPPFVSPSATSLSALATSVFPGLQDSPGDLPYPSPSNLKETPKKSSCSLVSEQPKPPGLEDEDLPSFPTSPQPKIEPSAVAASPHKFIPKSGVVLSVKRKVGEDGTSNTPVKAPRTKSRWGQGPAE